MGSVVENAGGLAPHCEVGSTAVDLRYQIGKKAPGCMHEYSPAPTDAEAADIWKAAPDGETDWLNAMPSGIKTWMQGRPAGERTVHRLCDVKMKAIAGL